MKHIITFCIILLPIRGLFCQNWTLLKDTISPIIEIASEYDTIFQQPLSGLGWEDGVHISEDGLYLYCTYVPIDLLSFSLNGELPNNFSANYLRDAPQFGVDLVTNPLSEPEWLHSDVLYSRRKTLSEPFSSWELSNMSRDFYSEGAPAPVFQHGGTSVEFMLYTSNDNPTNNLDIWIIENTSNNPLGSGRPLPAQISTLSNEDNPHLVRLQQDSLILFYDSDNLPGGKGDIDLWYSISVDNGDSWTDPSNVTSVNTSSKEHQPFLFYEHESQNYFLYYSALHSDGKLAIFRRVQIEKENWNSWGNAQLVVSAGNSAGIGEPTLTNNGDISFVVVYEDPIANSKFNRFDADPWFLKKKNSYLAGNNCQVDDTQIVLYPNPSTDIVYISSLVDQLSLSVVDSRGVLYYTGTEKTVNVKSYPSGNYYISILTKSGNHLVRKLIVKH